MEREQWEYWTGFLYPEATRPDIHDYLRDQLETANPPKFTPLSLIPQLNAMGADGWELLSVQPVNRGNNHDVMLQSDGSARVWSNAYLCVLKRRK